MLELQLSINVLVLNTGLFIRVFSLHASAMG